MKKKLNLLKKKMDELPDIEPGTFAPETTHQYPVL